MDDYGPGGEPVTLLIADQWMARLTGVELLAQARQLHPSARRRLLIRVMDRPAIQALSQAMTLGRLDGWVLKPWDPAEEHLYLPVSEQLIEWERAAGTPGFVGGSRTALGEAWRGGGPRVAVALSRRLTGSCLPPVVRGQAAIRFMRVAGGLRNADDRKLSQPAGRRTGRRDGALPGSHAGRILALACPSCDLSPTGPPFPCRAGVPTCVGRPGPPATGGFRA